MKPLVISFSGGRTSALMTFLLLAKYVGQREILVIFANTGKEREGTLEFINNCDLHFRFNTVWVESVAHIGEKKSSTFKVVEFKTANRSGVPFEGMIEKYGIPNINFPHCSRELKANPVKSYIKSLGWSDYEIALGMRYDEPKRLTKKPNVIYPLAFEFPHTKLMVNKWWHSQPFDLQIKEYEGNCDLCWKKSKRKLLTILCENPKIADWWNEMEIKYGQYVPESQSKKRLPPSVFFREELSCANLIEDSERPFKKASDTFTLAQLMHSEPELDFTNGCEESCEPF